MHIIIPLGGKGERFAREGFVVPKPYIPVLDKCMLEYVLDSLTLQEDDRVYVLHNHRLERRGSDERVTWVSVPDTRGAAETLLRGLDDLRLEGRCIVLDGDTFYTQDILARFRDARDNTVFYTVNQDPHPIYSYVLLSEEGNRITAIREKDKISDNANTGAYAFLDAATLHRYCRRVVDNGIAFRGEPYTSCVLAEMIQDGIAVCGHRLDVADVVSLGTPAAVAAYVDRTLAFLFDLDGTLVLTDDIYYKVWQEILATYHLHLTWSLFREYIQGNHDRYVLSSLLPNTDLSLPMLSAWKDRLFVAHLDQIRVVTGAHAFLDSLRKAGHKLCIVTNCNRAVAEAIVRHIGLPKIDFLVTSEDCAHGKPHKEPYERAMQRYRLPPRQCIVFEDSKTGILSAKGTSPLRIVGLATTYDASELQRYGADLSLRDFVDVDLTAIVGATPHHASSHTDNDLVATLTACCRRVFTDVQRVSVHPTKLKGGFIADVVAAECVTTFGDVHALVVKHESTSECNDLSRMAHQLALYSREYDFYQTIAPHMQVLCLPHYHGLLCDASGVARGIVLENLCARGFVMNLNLNEVSIDVTLTIVDRLAKMHVRFWNHPLQQCFPRLKRTDDAAFYPFFGNYVDSRYDAFLAKWTCIMTPRQLELCDQMRAHFTATQLRFATGDHLTLIHGDVKSPNLFYDTQHDNEPYFLDWQHCAVGKGVQDWVFLLIESFDVDNMDWAFALIKAYYYRKLVEAGITYTREEYENDIRDAIAYVPFFTAVWFGTIADDELIDKNFPYFFVRKLFRLAELCFSLPVLV